VAGYLVAADHSIVPFYFTVIRGRSGLIKVEARGHYDDSLMS